MAVIKYLIVLLLQCLLVDMYTHHKPVTQVEWRGRCTVDKLALNDCNWCRCNKKYKYTCDSRNCDLVDMFGHFNDAIRDMDVGMEGRGFWRTASLACEPGVQYRRSDLLCVCTNDGNWPNPVCRDIFRIMHKVELTVGSEVMSQRCSPTKLYLVDCNVCFCPSTGVLDPKLCMKTECPETVRAKEDEEEVEIPTTPEEEIYAECDPTHNYKMGCKTCECLRNNRLICGNCTFNKEEKVKNFCGLIDRGHVFNVGCNLCYCDEKNFTYCSTKKCLREELDVRVSLKDIRNAKSTSPSREPFDESSCIPGRTYKHGCNTCYCNYIKDKKVFTCTVKQCGRSVEPKDLILSSCVNGTSYELNCMICVCHLSSEVSIQRCWLNPECKSDRVGIEGRSTDLDSLHGYCEPLHVYKRSCNTCRCLADGKTLRCTSHACEEVQAPVTAEIVPVMQRGAACPTGLSYRIQCNYCFCLSNGNAICTTQDCSKDSNMLLN